MQDLSVVFDTLSPNPSSYIQRQLHPTLIPDRSDPLPIRDKLPICSALSAGLSQVSMCVCVLINYLSALSFPTSLSFLYRLTYFSQHLSAGSASTLLQENLDTENLCLCLFCSFSLWLKSSCMTSGSPKILHQTYFDHSGTKEGIHRPQQHLWRGKPHSEEREVIQKLLEFLSSNQAVDLTVTSEQTMYTM